MSNFLWPHGLYSPWNSPGHNSGVGSLSLLQGIFPTQGSNPGLPHCRWILYQLSHKGSPTICTTFNSSTKSIYLYIIRLNLTCIYIIFSHIQIPHSTLYHFKRFLYHLNLVELKNRKNSWIIYVTASSLNPFKLCAMWRGKWNGEM